MHILDEYGAKASVNFAARVYEDKVRLKFEIVKRSKPKFRKLLQIGFYRLLQIGFYQNWIVEILSKSNH